MSAPAASSSSTTSLHRFPWKWRLSDLDGVKKHGHTVFSCFACGGGSSMGYKLAGYDVLGNCEIDPRIAKVYAQNLHPKHPFVMDVRDFLKLPDEKIPQELFSLDVLDGSPPCTSFSLAGQREKLWGREKRFAEGQRMQRLDDLFFSFIAIAERLRPKVVVAENVKGMLVGNARGYVREIIKAFGAAGYDAQLFLLDASRLGVPQKRERTFFIARRKDLGLPPVKLSFSEPPIPFGLVRSEHGRPFSKSGGSHEAILKERRSGDRKISDVLKRLCLKESGFCNAIVADASVCPTLVATTFMYRDCDGLSMSREDVRNVSTFPQDYDFSGASAQFLCGMSVPPVMAAQVAAAVAEQIFGVPAPAGGFNEDKAQD